MFGEKDRAMAKILKRGGALLLVLVAGAALALGLMRAGAFNPSYEEVQARWGGTPSRFVQVDGVTLHVRDEGKGPVVLMLHSSMSNLRIWDAWADRLKTHYRVIRLDWPPYGLSRDLRPSTGLSGVMKLIEAFVEQEHLDRFAIVGSSSGATLSVLYTAAHPDKVAALALSTLPLEAPPPTHVSPAETATIWLHENVVPNYYPKFFYRWTLASLYGVPARLKPETVDWYYDTNNLDGGFARVRAYYQANKKSLWKKGAGTEAAQVKVPILLQWGDRDIVLPTYLADKAVKQFANAPVTLLHYPDVGHYPMLELPDETGRDLDRFLGRAFPQHL
jgi:pimeloyl-ACP methyl ester carboxylesterase